LSTEPEDAARRGTNEAAKFVGGWWAPLLVAGGTLAWCFLIYFLMGNRERNWQYGTVPYIPGSTIYVSRDVPNTLYPKPLVELPLPTQTTGGTGATR
jgi:hypothetical protein